MKFNGYPCISMDMHGYPWISMEVHGSPWMSMDVHGSPWTSMDVHGCPWISMDIHGYPYGNPWKSMDFRRFSQIFVCFLRFSLIFVQVRKVAENREKKISRFLDFYPLISAFQALACLANDRSRRDLSIGIKNSSFHALRLGIKPFFCFSIDFG